MGRCIRPVGVGEDAVDEGAGINGWGEGEEEDLIVSVYQLLVPDEVERYAIGSYNLAR